MELVERGQLRGEWCVEREQGSIRERDGGAAECDQHFYIGVFGERRSECEPLGHGDGGELDTGTDGDVYGQPDLGGGGWFEHAELVEQ